MILRIDDTRCGLCGTFLTRDRLGYPMLSPFSRGARVTLCQTCRRAALGEGYRPVA